MPKFTVIITRDITESTVLSVEAENAEAAEDAAFEKLRNTDNPTWEIDDGNCGINPPYITDVSEEE